MGVKSKWEKVQSGLLFTPVSITTLIGTEDARFILNGISPIAKGDLKWRDALLVTGTVNSNVCFSFICRNQWKQLTVKRSFGIIDI